VLVYIYTMHKLYLLTILISFSSFFANSQDSALYVSDAGNWSNPPWQILKYDIDGQNPEIFIFEQLAWPQDILFIESDGTVLITNLNSGKVTRYNASTGAYQDDFITGLNGPTRMKIGPDSLLYILQWNGVGMVKRFQLDGTFVDDFTSVGVNQSIGLDWDTDTNLYVSSYNGKSVRKFDVNGMDQGLFIDTNLLGPTNIWFDASGDLLVADYNGTSVKRFDANGILQGDFLTGLSQSEGVAFMDDQTILIGNGANGSVKHFETNGNFIGDLVTPSFGGLIRPNAVVIRDESSLSLAELNEMTVLVNPMPNGKYQVVANPAEPLELIITSATGQKVLEIEFIKETTFDPTSFSEGAYFVTVFNKKGHHKTQMIQR